MSDSPRHPLLPEEGCTWKEWFVPLAAGDLMMRDALESAHHIKANPDDIPFIIRLAENPELDIPWIRVFDGAVNLEDHDCIHCLLGRGLMPRDEAFVIGFTMGSTNRVSTGQQRLYEWVSKYLYPGPYKFDDDALRIFKDAVNLGFVSDCEPLDQIDYTSLHDLSLDDARQKVGIEADLLAAYFRIEDRRHPGAKESTRALAGL